MRVPAPQLRAWRPALSGVAEVLHARFTDHAYPMHAHSSWIAERLRARLGHPSVPSRPDSLAAYRLRDLLEDRVVAGLSLAEAAALLHFHPAHLVRAFGRQFGMSPHQYLISRRVDLARTLILQGRPLWSVAAGSGFYDQPHLLRHFKRILGVSPGVFARTGTRAA